MGGEPWVPIDSLGYQTVELELNPKNNGAFTGD